MRETRGAALKKPRSAPDLAGIDSEFVRAEIWSKAVNKYLSVPRMTAALLAAGVFVAIGHQVLMRLILPTIPLYVSTPILTFVAMSLMDVWFRWRSRRQLRETLRELGGCETCGFLTTPAGLNAGTCPECGAPSSLP